MGSLSSYLVLFLFGLFSVSAAPLGLDETVGNVSTLYTTVFPILVALSVLILFILFATGCICCQNKRPKSLGQENGIPMPQQLGNCSNMENSGTSEFTIFPPPNAILKQPSVLNNDEAVTFEPLPDIRLRKFSSPIAQGHHPRPAHFHTAINLGLSLNDWFDEPHSNFPRSQLQYFSEVGSGWFGQVVKGEAQQIVPGLNKVQVVVKILREDASPSEHMYFLHEARWLRDLSHPHILQMLGRCLEVDPFLIILEYCSLDLKTYLIQNRSNSEPILQGGQLLRMGCHVARGLLHMHENGFIHTDLAARNCLVYSDHTVKIGDYGTSLHSFKEDYFIMGGTALPIRWCSPELLVCTNNVIDTKEVTQESNIWSFGVLLWEMLELGKLPYMELGDNEVLQKVIMEQSILLEQPKTPCIHREQLWQVMRLCWNHPQNRPPMLKLMHMLDHLFDNKDIASDSVAFESRWNALQPVAREHNINPKCVIDPLGVALTFESNFVSSEPSQLNSAQHLFRHRDSNISDFDLLSTREASSSQCSLSASFEANFGTTISPSLQNLRGSIEDLEGDKKDHHQRSLSEQITKSQLLQIDDRVIDEQISEAIKELDDYLAGEVTSSEVSKDTTPERFQSEEGESESALFEKDKCDGSGSATTLTDIGLEKNEITKDNNDSGEKGLEAVQVLTQPRINNLVLSNLTSGWPDDDTVTSILPEFEASSQPTRNEALLGRKNENEESLIKTEEYVSTRVSPKIPALACPSSGGFSALSSFVTSPLCPEPRELPSTSTASVAKHLESEALIEPLTNITSCLSDVSPLTKTVDNCLKEDKIPVMGNCDFRSTSSDDDEKKKENSSIQLLEQIDPDLECSILPFFIINRDNINSSQIINNTIALTEENMNNNVILSEEVIRTELNKNVTDINSICATGSLDQSYTLNSDNGSKMDCLEEVSYPKNKDLLREKNLGLENIVTLHSSGTQEQTGIGKITTLEDEASISRIIHPIINLQMNQDGENSLDNDLLVTKKNCGENYNGCEFPSKNDTIEALVIDEIVMEDNKSEENPTNSELICDHSKKFSFKEKDSPASTGVCQLENTTETLNYEVFEHNEYPEILIDKVFDHKESDLTLIDEVFEHKESPGTLIDKVFDHEESPEILIDKVFDHSELARILIDETLDPIESTDTLFDDAVDGSTENLIGAVLDLKELTENLILEVTEPRQLTDYVLSAVLNPKESTENIDNEVLDPREATEEKFVNEVSNPFEASLEFGVVEITECEDNLIDKSQIETVTFEECERSVPIVTVINPLIQIPPEIIIEDTSQDEYWGVLDKDIDFNFTEALNHRLILEFSAPEKLGDKCSSPTSLTVPLDIEVNEKSAGKDLFLKGSFKEKSPVSSGSESDNDSPYSIHPMNPDSTTSFENSNSTSILRDSLFEQSNEEVESSSFVLLNRNGDTLNQSYLTGVFEESNPEISSDSFSYINNSYQPGSSSSSRPVYLYPYQNAGHNRRVCYDSLDQIVSSSDQNSLPANNYRFGNGFQEYQLDDILAGLDESHDHHLHNDLDAFSGDEEANASLFNQDPNDDSEDYLDDEILIVDTETNEAVMLDSKERLNLALEEENRLYLEQQMFNSEVYNPDAYYGPTKLESIIEEFEGTSVESSPGYSTAHSINASFENINESSAFKNCCQSPEGSPGFEKTIDGQIHEEGSPSLYSAIEDSLEFSSPMGIGRVFLSNCSDLVLEGDEYLAGIHTHLSENDDAKKDNRKIRMEYTGDEIILDETDNSIEITDKSTAKDETDEETDDERSIHETRDINSDKDEEDCSFAKQQQDLYMPDFESDTDDTSSTGTSDSSTSGSFECANSRFAEDCELETEDVVETIKQEISPTSPVKIFSTSWNCITTPTKSAIKSPEKKASDMKKSVSFHEEDPAVIFSYPPESESDEDNGLEDATEFSWHVDYSNYADWEFQQLDDEEIPEDIMDFDEIDDTPVRNQPLDISAMMYSISAISDEDLLDSLDSQNENVNTYDGLKRYGSSDLCEMVELTQPDPDEEQQIRLRYAVQNEMNENFVDSPEECPKDQFDAIVSAFECTINNNDSVPEKTNHILDQKKPVELERNETFDDSITDVSEVLFDLDANQSCHLTENRSSTPVENLYLFKRQIEANPLLDLSFGELNDSDKMSSLRNNLEELQNKEEPAIIDENVTEKYLFCNGNNHNENLSPLRNCHLNENSRKEEEEELIIFENSKEKRTIYPNSIIACSVVSKEKVNADNETTTVIDNVQS